MRELLQQALDALERCTKHTDSDYAAIAAIRTALAQKEAEPVAWRIFDGEGGYDYRDEEPELFDVDWAARYGRKYEPLYAAPQQARPQSEPMLWVPPEREGEFHHDHSSVTGYRNRMAGWMPLYAAPQPAPAVPAYTEGHCEEKAKKGGCQLHNLHCGYPACDRKPAPAAPAVREPLTGREIYKLHEASRLNTITFARSIEAHHGIAAPGSADHD